MLGIVLAGHTGFASGTLKSLKHLLGALPEQCISVEYTDWLSTNMLSRMMCDALHAADSGDGVVFITDILGAAPFRSAALMSHKHSKCEVVVGISLGAMIQLFPQRGGLTASEFRDRA
ncbi:MAG: PTS sugar transporter subunit IIA, partial [Enterobacterales bacterium]|nr:PTS sugar transporter subunit IIA [Enterobacterales bacterium]